MSSAFDVAMRRAMGLDDPQPAAGGGEGKRHRGHSERHAAGASNGGGGGGGRGRGAQGGKAKRARHDTAPAGARPQQQQQQPQQQQPQQQQSRLGAPGPGATLAECGFALRHGLPTRGSCAGFRASASGGFCAVCGRGPANHTVSDERASGSSSSGGNASTSAAARMSAEARTMRRAWLLLREARALGYCAVEAEGARVEDTLLAHRRRLSDLLVKLGALQDTRDGRRCPWAAELAQASQLASQLGQATHTSEAGRACAALRLLATLDAAYAELYVADALAGSAAGVPPPHAHLGTLIVGLGSGERCSECDPQAEGDGEQGSPAEGPLCRACSAVNPQLAYLRLRRAEADGPLGLTRLAACALAHEHGASPDAEDHGTMRGPDPVACGALFAWRAAVRDRVAAWSAFACPDAAAARALATFATPCGGRVLEVGAGTGYWAAFLGHAAPGLSVEAYDVRPPGAPGIKPNEYHGAMPAWGRVRAGDAAATAASRGDGRVLLLCYPPPGGRKPSSPPCMGLVALRAFRGARLALIGETRGDTGSAGLERELAADWDLSACHPLPNYANTVASLTLWTRRRGDSGDGPSAAVRPKAWPLVCVACGALPPLQGQGAPFLRDRPTRAVVTCSRACARSDAARTALGTELAARHLPPLGQKRGGGAAAASAAADNGFAWEGGDRGEALLWRAQVVI